ncbi:MAG: triose-phosphate isomerase [Alphaproteobacteria bacterium]
MRQKLIAGNWKMNGLKADGLALARAVADKVNAAAPLPFEVLICPPMSLLGLVCEVPHAGLHIGAEDVAAAPKSFGAFTGDVSAEMVADLGADYAIVGHSERRTLHRETNEIVKTKAQNAIRAGLKVIICIGETEAEREASLALRVVAEQIKGSVPSEATAENCVIAYEPVWAIGTGKTPTVADVAEVHTAIRQELAHLLGAVTAEGMRILYGGSVKPSNAKELLAVENVDGALIGGASLKADDFWAIAASQL